MMPGGISGKLKEIASDFLSPPTKRKISNPPWFTESLVPQLLFHGVFRPNGMPHSSIH